LSNIAGIRGLDVTTESRRLAGGILDAREAALPPHAISRSSIGKAARLLAREFMAPTVHPSAAARRIE